FTIEEAAAPDVVELLAPLEAVRGMPVVPVDAATAALVANGRVLPAPAAGPGPWALGTGDDRLLAVYEPFRRGQAKPAGGLGGGGESSSERTGVAVLFGHWCLPDGDHADRVAQAGGAPVSDRARSSCCRGASVAGRAGDHRSRRRSVARGARRGHDRRVRRG